MEGELKEKALEGALNEVVRRHEALRTHFEERDGVPEQVIEEAKYRVLEVIEAKGEEAVERLVREESNRPFDLGKGPVIRWKLVRVSERDHVLVVVTHHIASDGWSMGIFNKELGELYKSYSEGKESRLGELRVQYADFAGWQRGWLKGEVLGEQVGYWKERLKGIKALEMPTDKVRPLRQSYRGSTRGFEIGEEVLRGLKELGKEEGATLYMVLLAAFKVLLYRYSGQEDISVGTPIAGRRREEIEGLIGF